ncbi:MAG TPA: phage baseplate assembly protein V [bacterium]|nr:phage baseplate assembly protein V [bacterium]
MSPPNPKIAHLRYGIVRKIDPRRSRVKVEFPDQDRLVSHWLSLAQPKTLKDRAYWMVEPGEQVVCILDEHLEDGTVIGAIYSRPDPAPNGWDEHWFGIVFEDGSILRYRKDQHELLLDLTHMQGTVIVRSQEVKVEAQQVRVEAETVQAQATTLTAETQSASVTGITVTVSAPDITLSGLTHIDGDIDI